MYWYPACTGLLLVCLPAFAGARLGGSPLAPAGLAARDAPHRRDPRAAGRGRVNKTSQVLLAASFPRRAPDVDRRPSRGAGPDVVEFGIKVKGIVDINTAGTFTSDLILTYRWFDPRTAILVTDGLPKVPLSPDRAEAKIWMPDMEVSNSDVGGIHTVSESVSVAAGGTVTRTVRIIAVLLNHFDMTAFPFDKPKLRIRVVSKTLMRDELQLKPIKEPEFKGAGNDIFQGTDLELTNATERVFDEDDGMLRKSRGEMIVFSRRDPRVYLRQKLLPMFFLLMVSFGVFYFPLEAPFAMPRVGTSLIAFLALVTLGQKSTAGGGASWIDLFEEANQIMLFTTIFLNIFVLATKFEFKMEDLAHSLNNEMKVLPMILALMNFGILFYCTDPKDFGFSSYTTRMITAWGCFGFIALSGFRLNRELVSEGKGGYKIFAHYAPWEAAPKAS